MSKFEVNLKTAFSESLYDLCLQERETDPARRRLEEQYSRLFDRIRDRLDKKHRKLMLRLETLGNEKDGRDDELIYLQGIIDCVKLLKIMKVI